MSRVRRGNAGVRSVWTVLDEVGTAINTPVPTLAGQLTLPRVPAQRPRGAMPPTNDATVARALARARTKAVKALADQLDRISGEVTGAATRAREVDDARGALDILRTINALAGQLDELRTTATAVAREYDATWDQVGDAVGMARGNALNWHKRRAS